ncbi:alpha/beta hydrolase, partial [Staphylococcus aureus]|uniref:alpha/beta hydrolase n=1 Tax=Staphylococcus aureus TaxID=1280 RepID=UPI002181E8E1
SVDYRLAPEHPYPAAIEDCYLALQWIVENQQSLSVDIDRLAVELTEERLPLIREVNKKLIEPYKNSAITQKEYYAIHKNNVKVRLKVYAPINQKQDLPVVLFIHGGGCVFGTVEGNDAKCAQYVKEVNCVVVSVDYRLAPEHPYPAAIEDCYLALQWIVENQQSL